MTAVNDSPVATAQSVTTAEDTAVTITLAGTDADGDALTYTVVNQPSNGTLSGTAPNLTYTPTPTIPMFMLRRGYSVSITIMGMIHSLSRLMMGQSIANQLPYR